ncbi:MAG: T9SS type A sorting domain-containing protein [Brumimicrobium sp.]|nr:T9SS type A sorting domain-containing protein [Brumimicrobium sp.]
MKRILLAVSTFLVGTSLMAQAPFTQTNAPQVGDATTYFVLDSTAANLDATVGTGVTWDYSGTAAAAPGLTNAASVITPTTAPYSIDFPLATEELVIDNFMTTYTATTSSTLNSKGFIFTSDASGDIVVKFNTGANDANVFNYPYGLNDAVTNDAFTGTATVDGAAIGYGSGPMNLDVTGIINTKFDGYGTLKLANNTYTNVKRVKITENATAKYFTVPIAAIGITQYEYYDHDNSRLPIFIHSKMDFDLSAIGQPVSSRTVVMSIDDPNTSNISSEISGEFKVYPNPATNQLNIVNPSANGETVIVLVDNLGRTVYSTTSNDITTTIDVTSLNKGIYFVNVIEGNTKSVQKIVIE